MVHRCCDDGISHQFTTAPRIRYTSVLQSLTRHPPHLHKKRVFLSQRSGQEDKTLSEILVEVGGYKNNDDGSEVSQTADKR